MTGLKCDEVFNDTWAKRFIGDFASDFSVDNRGGESVARGRMEVRNGTLTALPVLDALAAYADTRAYRAVGATRTATARLVHGVRRRVEHALGGQSGATSDETFLAWARDRAPARAADVDLVRQALARPVSRRELGTVGHALRRLESSLTSFPRPS